jgi:hypothetical protein
LILLSHTIPAPAMIYHGIVEEGSGGWDNFNLCFIVPIITPISNTLHSIISSFHPNTKIPPFLSMSIKPKYLNQFDSIHVTFVTKPIGRPILCCHFHCAFPHQYSCLSLIRMTVLRFPMAKPRTPSCFRQTLQNVSASFLLTLHAPI